MKRAISTLLLAAVICAAPARGQQIVCQPGQNGTTICEQQPRVSGRRLAVVAAALVGVAVIVYVIRKTHKRHAPAPTEQIPQTPEKTPAAGMQ